MKLFGEIVLDWEETKISCIQRDASKCPVHDLHEDAW